MRRTTKAFIASVICFLWGSYLELWTTEIVARKSQGGFWYRFFDHSPVRLEEACELFGRSLLVLSLVLVTLVIAAWLFRPDVPVKNSERVGTE